MVQHKVTDELGVNWIVDDEDEAAFLWRDIPNLPQSGILVPRALLLPGYKPDGDVDQLLPKLSFQSVTNDEVMYQMVREQMFHMLRQHYGV